MILDKLFKKKKLARELLCDICGKSVLLSAELIPPAVLIDYNDVEIKTVCGYCQFRLGLVANDKGFIYKSS